MTETSITINFNKKTVTLNIDRCFKGNNVNIAFVEIPKSEKLQKKQQSVYL